MTNTRIHKKMKATITAMRKTVASVENFLLTEVSAEIKERALTIFNEAKELFKFLYPFANALEKDVSLSKEYKLIMIDVVEASERWVKKVNENFLCVKYEMAVRFSG